MASFGFISFLSQSKKYVSALIDQKKLNTILYYAIPTVFIFSVYYAFFLEIQNYWVQTYIDSKLIIQADGQEYYQTFWNSDLNSFKAIWLINYSLIFVSILSFLNIKKLRNQELGLINLGLNVFVIVVFLLLGLFELSELRESYIEQTLVEYYERGMFHIGIRYVSFAFVALVVFDCYKYIQLKMIKRDLTIAFDVLLHTTILWVISSELINWMDLAGAIASYKLGISILWGLYSLLLITLGIWKKKKHLRIGAISLLALTLLKLFSYDISHLDTIAKTIVFVSLGVLLLIISFLYNKFKKLIFDEKES